MIPASSSAGAPTAVRPARPRRIRRATALGLGALAVAAGAVVGATGSSAAPAAPPDPDPEPFHYEQTFEGDELPEGWNPAVGEWSVRDGRLHLDEPAAIARITFGPHLDNYELEATIRFESVNNASRWAGVMTDVPADGSPQWSQAVMRSQSTAANGIEFAIRTAGNAWQVPNAGPAPTDAGVGQDVRVRIVVQGSQGRWYFDDELVLTSSTIPRSADGVLGIVADGARISVDDVVVTELPPPSFVRDPELGPVTIAHRGYSSVTPENTLVAVETALRTGAEMIEIDTLNAADGASVVMHDTTVDRTTDGSGPVAGMTREQIAELDAGSWLSPVFAGEPVPFLEDVLDLIQGRGPTLLLEIKPGATYAHTEAQLQAVLDRDMADQVLVQSFDLQVVIAARQIAPEIPRAFLSSTLAVDPVAFAREHDLAAYNPSIAALRTRPEIVAALNAEGVAVMPWTINDAATWAWLSELGVDGVITDRAGAHVGFREGSPIEVTIVNPEPTAPAVRVEQATSQPDPATEQPVLFDVLFSEPVVGFSAAGVAIGGTAEATGATVTEVEPGMRYSVAVDGATQSGTVTVTVPEGAATNAAGVASAASTSTDNEVTLELVPDPVADCAVTYTVHGTWPDGFNAQVDLVNTGETSLAGWTLGWGFTAGETIRNGWSGAFSQEGTAVTVENLSWNRTVRPGDSVTVGFIGGIDGGDPAIPEVFTLDGVPCAG